MKSIQKGKAVSHGIGIGKVYIYKHYVPNIQKKVIEQKDIKKELESFVNTQKKAKAEVMTSRLARRCPPQFLCWCNNLCEDGRGPPTHPRHTLPSWQGHERLM